MTSIYGLHLHWRRYGEKSSEYSKGLEHSEFESKQFFEKLQRRELTRLLDYAYQNTDYYKELFDKLDLRPTDIKRVNELEKLPILTKEEIKKNTQAFVSKKFKKRHLFKIYTSGTTGSPLTVFCDLASRRKNYAFFNRVRRWRGTRVRDKRVTFYGRVIIPPAQEVPPFWRYDIAENNFLFCSYHMSPANLPYYYEKVRGIQPAEIRGYPSSLYNLAQYMLEHRLSDIHPKAVFTTAETLFEPIREVIETAFKCKITDTYGCTEMGFYITQCEYGTYHAHPEYGIVEVLDDNGKRKKGEAGHLVCTSFINYAMPLIRYKVGDTIAVKDKECRCKRHFPVIDEIVGRTDDIIVTPEGRRIGRLDPIFKGGLGIKEAQIIQTGQGEIVMRVVKNERYSPRDVEFLSDQLRKRVGDSMKIRFEFVPEIKKEKNGKFKSVISLVNQQ